MKLAVAQIRLVAGDIPANLAQHVDAVYRAVELGAELVLFSELSLTGYEPTLAQRLAAQTYDSRFDRLQTLSDSHAIVICAGMPLAVDTGVEIGMLLFQPGSPRQTYSKQLLHADELPYFVCGKSQTLLRRDDYTLAPAICFESLQPQHAEAAANLGADVYTLASGSSSCASAAVAKRLGLCDSSITVHMPGGQLAIEVNENFAVRMTGPVIRVANGHLSHEMFNADETVHQGEPS